MLTDLQKRIVAFLFGCIVVRSLFVVAARKANKEQLKLMGYLALLPAIGFFYIFLTGSRKTGRETFGGKLWWNDLRPIHGLLYALFAYLAINGVKKDAWKVLLVDVILGLVSFLIYHGKQGNFNF
jgi:hypothetical protein